MIISQQHFGASLCENWDARTEQNNRNTYHNKMDLFRGVRARSFFSSFQLLSSVSLFNNLVSTFNQFHINFILCDDSFVVVGWFAPKNKIRSKWKKWKWKWMDAFNRNVHTHNKNIARKFRVMFRENSPDLDSRAKWKKTRYLNHLWKTCSLNLSVSMYGRHRVNVYVCRYYFLCIRFDLVPQPIRRHGVQKIYIFISTYQRFG